MLEKRLKLIWITPLVIALAVASIVVLVVDGVGASPSLTASIRIGGFGEVDYYASQPMPNVPPGLLVRVFLINGSVIEPVDAFIDVYANAPNGIVHVSMGYSTTLIVPFSNVNWQYVINKWVLLGVSSSEYETSMLIFITYVRGNESWILPLVIPYNVAWAIKNSRYIVVNAFINVNSIKPSEVIPAMPGTTVMNVQLPSNHSDYTTYNCDLSAPKPPLETTFKPEITCLGFNGSLPATWVTWDKDVIKNNSGLSIDLTIDFWGAIRWDAMATGYGDIGTSYSAPEDLFLSYSVILSSQVTQSSPAYQVTQPGSVYWYYGGATWGIVDYTVWFVNSSMGTYHLGNATIFEVLYIPPNSNYVGIVLDYGNGPVSLLYYLASKHYLEYPVSSIINYAAFIYTGQEYLYQCNGPVTNASTTSGTAYAITLGGVETAYGLGPAQLGTTLTSLSLGSGGLGMPPPQASVSLTSVSLELFNITTGMNLFISVVNASAVYGLPTFGFILNATNYYGNPTTYTCKYNQWVQIG
ncbi:MAG: hypothetical protein AT713_05530 [Caldivirga sp. JCHS_4]|nr:MAG: hypothetical protein AT713_05530 [Caldivirga sp. JCHS_4]